MDYADYGTEGIVEIEYSGGSDYSGDAVTLSNFQVLKEEFKDAAGVYELSGGYGTYGIGYRPGECTAETLERIKEIEDGLEDYPLIDEDHFSEMEFNIKSEAWEGESPSDIFPEEYLSLPESFLSELKAEIWKKWNETETPGEIETGGSVYFRPETIKSRLEGIFPLPAPFYKDLDGWSASQSKRIFTIEAPRDYFCVIKNKEGEKIMGEDSSMSLIASAPAEILSAFREWEF